jgi:hypothetical protein
MAHAPWCPAWSHALRLTRAASKKGSQQRQGVVEPTHARSSRGPDGGTETTPFPTLGGVLNFVGSTFGGANPTRLATSESLGERALGFAWDVFHRFSPSRGADNSRLDPAILARAARRASDAERDTARDVWASRVKRDAETGALLCLGITVLRREEGLAADIRATCASVTSLETCLQCSVTAASLALHREPQLLQVSPAALTQRMLAYRRAVPTADLTRMVLNCPTLLALADAPLDYFQTSVSRLRAALSQCDWVDTCVQEDPELMLSNFTAGLADLTSLWTADELATMDAEEAALALRTLSGLPRRGVIPGWTNASSGTPSNAAQ